MSIEQSGVTRKIIDLLKSGNLPVSDLDMHSSDMPFFTLEIANRCRGCIGLELFDNAALLRSLFVHPKFRGKGYGRQLVQHAENYAKSKQIASIFLLTEDAETFFEHTDYSRIPRNEAPQEIRQTEQFSNLCPSSASFMGKKIMSGDGGGI